MTKMEPYIRNWFGYLKEGKIMGVKCKRCGAYEFPPHPICNSCSGTDMEWAEMSGEGRLTAFAYAPMGVPPYFTDPVMGAWIKLKEGPAFMSWLLDVGGDNQEELLKRLPLDVKAEVKKLDENVSWPVFRIKQDARS